MKIELSNYGMMITPETEFEEKWLRENYGIHKTGKIKAFLKHGSSADQLVGLRVFREETFASERPSGPLSEMEIRQIAENMPGGLDGFCKGWGWEQFAREIERVHGIQSV